MYNIENVFGMQRGDVVHYVERTQVDDEFVRSLTRDKHLCVYGSSKQGKTALRKKHISPREEIVIVCDPNWTNNDLFAAILKAAGCTIEVSHSVSVKDKVDVSGGVEATVKVPLFEVKGKLGTSGGEETTTERKLQSFPVNLGDIADVINILSRAYQGRYIVVEEFHYLQEKVQRNFALKLKAVHELSKYLFIIVGVWLEKNRMAHLNPDLAGRVAAINADDWTDDDLARVVQEGGTKLNIEFPPGFAKNLVSKACGSVYLVREACHRACEDHKIYIPPDELFKIERLSAEDLLDRMNLRGVDYPGRIMAMLGVEGIEQSEQEKEEDLKGWVIRGLIYASAKEVRNGVPLNRIRTLISNHHPYKYQPSVGQIGRILASLQVIQNLKPGYSLFDYDRHEKIMRCVDKGYILWRASQRLDKIQDLVLSNR
jgi:hypothetical protein